MIEISLQEPVHTISLLRTPGVVDRAVSTCSCGKYTSKEETPHEAARLGRAHASRAIRTWRSRL